MKCEKCGKTYKKEENSIIRCKNVCNKCFRILDKDNKFRQKNGFEIPNSFDLKVDLIQATYSRSQRWVKRVRGTA